MHACASINTLVGDSVSFSRKVVRAYILAAAPKCRKVAFVCHKNRHMSALLATAAKAYTYIYVYVYMWHVYVYCKYVIV